MPSKMGDETTYAFRNFNSCTMGMDKWFHPTLYNGCSHSSMLRSKLHHVNKRGSRWQTKQGGVKKMQMKEVSSCLHDLNTGNTPPISRFFHIGWKCVIWHKHWILQASCTWFVFVCVLLWLVNVGYHSYPSGVGVTKAPFVNFSISKIFDLAKVNHRSFESHSYLTGIAAAQLRRYLSNMNMIFNIQRLFRQYWKIRKI